jgi:hypothetical protein
VVGLVAFMVMTLREILEQLRQINRNLALEILRRTPPDDLWMSNRDTTGLTPRDS